MTDTTDPQTGDLPDRLEAVLTERFTELGNPFSRMRIAFQGADGWPASKEVGPHDVAEVLRELLADAPAVLPPAADRAAVLRELEERYRGHARDSVHPDFRAAYSAVANDLSRLADEEQQAETQAPEPPPVCEGFRWIGQSFATCDRCGQPAWDHAGEEVPVEGAGPFDTRRTVRPWKPGEADAIRAKWAPPAVVAEPGKDPS